MSILRGCGKKRWFGGRKSYSGIFFEWRFYFNILTGTTPGKVFSKKEYLFIISPGYTGVLYNFNEAEHNG